MSRSERGARPPQSQSRRGGPSSPRYERSPGSSRNERERAGYEGSTPPNAVPNTLQVTVVSARLPPDAKGHDVRVGLAFGDAATVRAAERRLFADKKTKRAYRCTDARPGPATEHAEVEWNKKFYFLVDHTARASTTAPQKLSVRVRRSRALGDEMEIGACEVDLKLNEHWKKHELAIDRLHDGSEKLEADSLDEWFDLKRDGAPVEGDYGEIYLKINLFYDPKHGDGTERGEALDKALEAFENYQQGESDSEDEDEQPTQRGSGGGGGSTGLISYAEREFYLQGCDSAAKAIAHRAHNRGGEQRGLVSGTYLIVAHVIQAIDLNGENFDNTADPHVEVRVLGRMAESRHKSGVTSGVWDEKFYFRFDDLTLDELRAATIVTEVMDDNDLMADQAIGRFTTDLESVYQLEQHELYRKWVPLVDNTEESDEGVQARRGRRRCLFGGFESPAPACLAPARHKIDPSAPPGVVFHMRLGCPVSHRCMKLTAVCSVLSCRLSICRASFSSRSASTGRATSRARTRARARRPTRTAS